MSWEPTAMSISPLARTMSVGPGSSGATEPAENAPFFHGRGDPVQHAAVAMPEKAGQIDSTSWKSMGSGRLRHRRFAKEKPERCARGSKGRSRCSARGTRNAELGMPSWECPPASAPTPSRRVAPVAGSVSSAAPPRMSRTSWSRVPGRIHDLPRGDVHDRASGEGSISSAGQRGNSGGKTGEGSPCEELLRPSRDEHIRFSESRPS